MSLKGQTALVTGATRGIGEAIALGLAEQGIVVGLIDIRDPGPTAEKLPARGYTALPFTADVADSESVGSAVDTMIQRFGRIDILVNNAGIIVRESILELSLETWHPRYFL